MKTTNEYRVEHDLLGKRELPVDALYGIQTLRGLENFSISRFRLDQYPLFINGLAYTKWAAADANHQLGLLTDEQFGAIKAACEDILAGKYHEQFPVDMIQGGAGTTTNMNANEVIANIALIHMGHQPGDYDYCSPHDQVNRSQSTNDAYPTAIHIGLYASHLRMIPHLKELIASLNKKGDEFAHIIKMGRTQLEDAVPMTLGQTFHGFASILENEILHLNEAAADFLTVNLGATAIGTGICSEPGYAEKAVEALARITGWKVDDELISFPYKISANTTFDAVYQLIDYNIQKSITGEGSIKLSKELANVGDEILITCNPNLGYEISKIYYKIDGQDQEIEIENNKFVMPAKNIIVYVEFVKINYAILKDGVTNGDFTVSKDSACFGEDISVSFMPNPGYELEEVYYIIEGGQEKIVIENSHFIMPIGNITIYVKYIPITYNITLILNDGII